MSQYSYIEIAGTAYYNAEHIRVRSSTNRGNASFEVLLPNDAGIYKTTFSVGNDVVVYLDTVNPPTTKIFRGVIEDIEFIETGSDLRSKVKLSGRDYGARLMDVTVEPSVFTNSEVSVIVKNLIDSFVTGITYTNTQTTPLTLSRIVFKHKSVWDCVKQLAEYVNYDVYVDATKDLVFRPKGNVSASLTIDNTNAIRASFTTTTQDFFNEIWVYGGKYLSGWRNDFTADGAGSVFTLDYKPFDLYATVGGTKKLGGIYQASSSLVSGVHYLVDLGSKNVIFVSGTNVGNNIPGSNVAIVCTYNRLRPIVKVANNQSSIDTYGKRSKIIVDHEIDDPIAAQTLAKSQADLYSLPLTTGVVDLQNVTTNVIASQTVIVNLPNENVSNLTYTVLDADYDITTENLLHGTVLKLRLAQRVKDAVDTFKQMILDIKQLQAENMDDTDIITRILYANGSYGIGSNSTPGLTSYQIKTRNIGEKFYLDSDDWFKLDCGSVLDATLVAGSWAGAVTSGTLSIVNDTGVISGTVMGSGVCAKYSFSTAGSGGLATVTATYGVSNWVTGSEFVGFWVKSDDYTKFASGTVANSGIDFILATGTIKYIYPFYNQTGSAGSYVFVKLYTGSYNNTAVNGSVFPNVNQIGFRFFENANNLDQAGSFWFTHVHKHHANSGTKLNILDGYSGTPFVVTASG